MATVEEAPKPIYKIGQCKMIQWEQTYVRDGQVVCPKCGRPAEQVIGIIGNPCWAHVSDTP